MVEFVIMEKIGHKYTLQEKSEMKELDLADMWI